MRVQDSRRDERDVGAAVAVLERRLDESATLAIGTTAACKRGFTASVHLFRAYHTITPLLTSLKVSVMIAPLHEPGSNGAICELNLRNGPLESSVDGVGTASGERGAVLANQCRLEGEGKSVLFSTGILTAWATNRAISTAASIMISGSSPAMKSMLLTCW